MFELCSEKQRFCRFLGPRTTKGKVPAAKKLLQGSPVGPWALQITRWHHRARTRTQNRMAPHRVYVRSNALISASIATHINKGGSQAMGGRLRRPQSQTPPPSLEVACFVSYFSN